MVRSTVNSANSVVQLLNIIFFTALHVMQTRYSDENSVCLEFDRFSGRLYHSD